MNSCVLMAQIISSPELRYTQERQTPMAQMLVQFSSQRPNEPPSTLRAIGWGDRLSAEIHNNYQEGDLVIIHGRLSMNTIDRQEGFKEKRAELSISHIYKVEGNLQSYTNAFEASSQSSNLAANNTNAFPSIPAPTAEPSTAVADRSYELSSPAAYADTDSDTSDRDLDDIPFLRPVRLTINNEVDLQDPWEIAAHRPGTYLPSA